jgi:hypothetical protein
MFGRICGCVLVLFAFLQTGCLRTMSQLFAVEQPVPLCPPVRTIIATELPAPTLERVGAEGEVNAIPQYEAAMRARLMARSFEELEQTAANLRASKERFPGGAWKLERFYSGVSYPSRDGKSSDQEWQAHLDELRTWVASRPNSLTAQIALGKALLGYAWYARGDGYANTITNEGGRPYAERSDRAEQILSGVGEMRKTDPAWCTVMLEVGVSQGWSRKAFDQVFEEGISVEPLYYYLYFEKARYLMPRWYGKQFDDERFMDETQRRLGGKEGLAMYYLIGEYLFPYYEYRTIVTSSKICWETMKEGYFAMESLYGVALTRLNTMAKLTGIAAEKPLCNWLFVRLGDRWDPEVWPKGKADFDQYRCWANS